MVSISWPTSKAAPNYSLAGCLPACQLTWRYSWRCATAGIFSNYALNCKSSSPIASILLSTRLILRTLSPSPLCRYGSSFSLALDRIIDLDHPGEIGTPFILFLDYGYCPFFGFFLKQSVDYHRLIMWCVWKMQAGGFIAHRSAQSIRRLFAAARSPLARWSRRHHGDADQPVPSTADRQGSCENFRQWHTTTFCFRLLHVLVQILSWQAGFAEDMHMAKEDFLPNQSNIIPHLALIMEDIIDHNQVIWPIISTLKIY